MKFRRDKTSKPIPVLLDQALLERITAMSERIGEAKSTVMRIAMRMGLEGLEKSFEIAAAQKPGTPPRKTAAASSLKEDTERKLLEALDKGMARSAAAARSKAKQ